MGRFKVLADRETSFGSSAQFYRVNKNLSAVDSQGADHTYMGVEFLHCHIWVENDVVPLLSQYFASASGAMLLLQQRYVFPMTFGRIL